MKKLLLSLSMIVLVSACTVNGMDYLNSLMSSKPTTTTKQTPPPVPPRTDLGETGEEPMGIFPGETPEVPTLGDTKIPANLPAAEQTEISKIFASIQQIFTKLTALIPQVQELVKSVKEKSIFSGVKAGATIAAQLVAISPLIVDIVAEAKKLAKASPAAKELVTKKIEEAVNSPQFEKIEDTLRESVKDIPLVKGAVDTALDKVNKLPEQVQETLQK